MPTSYCGSIKKSLLAAMSAGTSVLTRGSTCVLTLPLRTIDGRFVEIFVERKIGDFVLVHDAGKTVGALHVQGVHWTESRRDQLSVVAERFGARLDERGVFQIACAEEDVANAALMVSQCATVGLFELAHHHPVVEEEPVGLQVKRALKHWKPKFLDVHLNVKIRGANGADHLFDSVAHNKDTRHRTVAVKTLPFGYGARVQADRYGFMVLDIKDTEYNKWRRLAVVSQVDRWPLPSLKIVRQFSADTLELRTGEEHFSESQLVEKVRTLSETKRTA